MNDKLRMDAYWYEFTRTGIYEIDKILSEVASAGKGYHHTEEWADAGCIQRIQDAANIAADRMKQLEKIDE